MEGLFFFFEGWGEIHNNEAQRELMYCAKPE